MATSEIVPVSTRDGTHFSPYLKTRCRLLAAGFIEDKRNWPTALYATEHSSMGNIDTGFQRFSSWQGVMSGEKGRPVFGEVDLSYALLTRKGWDSQSDTTIRNVLRATNYSVRRPRYPSGGSTPNSSGGWAIRTTGEAGIIHEDSLVLSLDGANLNWQRTATSSNWALVYVFCGFNNVESLDLEQWTNMALNGAPASEPHAQSTVLGACLPVVRKKRESSWRIRIEPDPWV